jgi:hypothetical protein
MRPYCHRCGSPGNGEHDGSRVTLDPLTACRFVPPIRKSGQAGDHQPCHRAPRVPSSTELAPAGAAIPLGKATVLRPARNVTTSVSLQGMTATPSGPRHPVPTSVSYARALVFLQAACWGLLSLLGIYWALASKSAAPDGIVVEYRPAWAIGVVGVAAALTAAKTRLGIRISHRSRGTRRTVMIVEYMMASFAVVVCLLTLNMNGGDIPFLASLFGGPMSLIAAIRLNEPPARQYFGELPGNVTPTTPGSPCDGSQRHLFALPARG